jgi:hypothetical protein
MDTAQKQFIIHECTIECIHTRWLTFATAVPDPMAIPISAFFSAGASLTPSPVIAT